MQAKKPTAWAEKPNRRVRDLRLVVRGNSLILHGRTHTYYAKQLAQHAVMQATRLPIQANEIEVT